MKVKALSNTDAVHFKLARRIQKIRALHKNARHKAWHRFFSSSETDPPRCHKTYFKVDHFNGGGSLVTASIGPKLLGAEVAEDTLRQLGWPETHVLMLGLIELACLALYLYPRTSVAGVIFLTAYLGGAIATQVRVANPLFSHILFGVYLGLIFWCGLWLRHPRLRMIFPLWYE